MSCCCNWKYVTGCDSSFPELPQFARRRHRLCEATPIDAVIDAESAATEFVIITTLSGQLPQPLNEFLQSRQCRRCDVTGRRQLVGGNWTLRPGGRLECQSRVGAFSPHVASLVQPLQPHLHLLIDNLTFIKRKYGLNPILKTNFNY